MALNHLLLVSTRVFTPYAKDEVFGLPEETAQKLLSMPDSPVRLFNPDKDQDLLDAMDGKRSDDATAQVVVTNAPKAKAPEAAKKAPEAA